MLTRLVIAVLRFHNCRPTAPVPRGGITESCLPELESRPRFRSAQRKVVPSPSRSSDLAFSAEVTQRGRHRHPAPKGSSSICSVGFFPYEGVPQMSYSLIESPTHVSRPKPQPIIHGHRTRYLRYYQIFSHLRSAVKRSLPQCGNKHPITARQLLKSDNYRT